MGAPLRSIFLNIVKATATKLGWKVLAEPALNPISGRFEPLNQFVYLLLF
jgi:hypothetical protein